MDNIFLYFQLAGASLQLNTKACSYRVQTPSACFRNVLISNLLGCIVDEHADLCQILSWLVPIS